MNILMKSKKKIRVMTPFLLLLLPCFIMCAPFPPLSRDVEVINGVVDAEVNLVHLLA